MKKLKINVFLTVGVEALLLFSGSISGIILTSPSTITDTSIKKITALDDDAVITCYVGGLPQSQIISYESGTLLKEMFSKLAIANAHDPCSAETQQLQSQILLYAEQQGLLPVGMSANQILVQIEKRNQDIDTQNINSVSPLNTQGTGRVMFCNFVSTGEGGAFPIIILPRLIPIIMAPIPRVFVGWKTTSGITSCGGLMTGTGFIASGQQQGMALGFWGIGFSIFLPPVMAYGMFGYALYAKVSAENIEYWPPNNLPKVDALYPLNGATYVPLSTSELRFQISDFDSDLMSYSVTTNPDIGGGNGNSKPDGTYTIPIYGLKSYTEYTWHVNVSDGIDVVETEFKFKTEAVAPIVSEVIPINGYLYVPITQQYLRFHLRDPQNDLMSYTVETSPFIGSGSGSNVGEGDISVPINGLDYMSEYRWFVNVTDGVNPTSEMFWFRTEPVMVFDPFTEGWEYRKMITVNHAMVAGDLEHFPILLSTTDIDLRDEAQDDGDDILFMDGAGVATRLYHELGEFDGSTGQLIAWINMSSLSTTVDTSLYMYYGNMNSCNQQCPENTWDSNYVGVWHFDESIGSTVADSTSNMITGIANTGAMITTGFIGKARNFDGSSGFVDLGTSYLLGGIPMYTIEAWVNPTSISGETRIFDRGQSGNPNTVLFFQDSGKLHLQTNNNDNLESPEVVPVGTWINLVGTFTGSGGEIALYANGMKIATRTSTQLWPTEGSIQTYIGTAAFTSGYKWHGLIDELRFSKTARTAAWISTSYQNQNNPTSFMVIGPEEPSP
jgi:hypothetical protein